MTGANASNAVAIDATQPAGGELVGLDVGNHLPAGDAAKLAQKAHEDYRHGNIEPDAIERDGKINPIVHAWNKFKEAGWSGAVTMAVFGTVFLALSSLGINVAETFIDPKVGILGFEGAAKFIGSLGGVITTGLTWYGSKAAMQAYQDANEHNHTLEKIKSGELSPELALEKQKTSSLDQNMPEKEIAAVVATPVLMVADPSIIAAQANEAEAARPEFLSKILADGPKSLSPKELAAQIEAERSAAEQSI